MSNDDLTTPSDFDDPNRLNREVFISKAYQAQVDLALLIDAVARQQQPSLSPLLLYSFANLHYYLVELTPSHSGINQWNHAQRKTRPSLAGFSCFSASTAIINLLDNPSPEF